MAESPNNANKSIEEFNKEDLLRLLACLQSELEARESVINSLKTGGVHYACPHIKYGSLKELSTSEPYIKDPFHALQRDSLLSADASAVNDEDRPIRYTQILQLENLIASQKAMQENLRKQLQKMEEKCSKVNVTVDEKRECKHCFSSSDSDTWKTMEKEKMINEVELEKVQRSNLEKALKGIFLSWVEQKQTLVRQKQAAVAVIKEHRRLTLQTLQYQKRIRELEKIVDENIMSPLHPNSRARDRRHSSSDATEEAGVIQQPFEEYNSLREKLDMEVRARMELQRSFDRLQRDYETLVASLRESCPTSDSPTGSLNVTVGQTGDNPSSALRAKPHPPLRWSSENFGSERSSPPTGISPPHTSTNAHEILTTVSAPDKSTSPVCPLTLTLSSQTTSLLSSESRSSTPSPPPPPPPVQLHYPYPSIQNYHHPQTRLTGTTPQFLSSTSGRPLSVPPSHSTPTRGVLSSSSTQQTLSFQPNFRGPSIHPTTRPQQTSPNVGCVVVPRRAGVVTPSVRHSHGTSHSSAYQHPYATPFTPPHIKHLSTTSSTFTQRNHTGSPPGSFSATHHFPYSPSRINTTGGPTYPVMRMVRATSVSLSATPVSGGNPSVSAGHICLNGK